MGDGNFASLRLTSCEFPLASARARVFFIANFYFEKKLA